MGFVVHELLRQPNNERMQSKQNWRGTRIPTTLVSLGLETKWSRTSSKVSSRFQRMRCRIEISLGEASVLADKIKLSGSLRKISPTSTQRIEGGFSHGTKQKACPLAIARCGQHPPHFGEYTPGYSSQLHGLTTRRFSSFFRYSTWTPN